MMTIPHQPPDSVVLLSEPYFPLQCVKFLLQRGAPTITCYRPEDDSSSSLSDFSDDNVSVTTLPPLPSLLHLAVMDGEREMWGGERMERRRGGGGGGKEGKAAQVLVELLQKVRRQLEETDHLGKSHILCRQK